MARRPGQGCLGVAPTGGTDESFFISKHRDLCRVISQMQNAEEGLGELELRSSVNIAMYEL